MTLFFKVPPQGGAGGGGPKMNRLSVMHNRYTTESHKGGATD